MATPATAAAGPLSSYADFEEAAADVLRCLQAAIGFDLWMVTRTEGDAWIVLAAADKGYGVRAGEVFRWSDSFCSRMVRGEGPRIAPDAAAIDVYAEAPIASALTIGAYIGMPLHRSDGSLFGTLCAIDPDPASPEVTSTQPVVESMARLLSTILEHELRLDTERRRAEQLELLAHQDALTGLHNRRAWTALLTAEQQRCMRFGHPSAVVAIDLDELKQVNDLQGHAAGDDLLRLAAHLISQTARGHDVVARIGGDEFVVLAVECADEDASALAERVRAALDRAGVAASVGVSSTLTRPDLFATWQEADAAMYAEKAKRRQRSTTGPA